MTEQPAITTEQLAALRAELHDGDWPAHVLAHLREELARGLIEAADLVPAGHPMAGNAAVWRKAAEHWDTLCGGYLLTGGWEHSEVCRWCELRPLLVAAARAYVEGLL